MPKKGGKKRFTAKQDRQADHIADSMQARGMSRKKAESVGYATVNKNKSRKRGGKKR